MKSFLTKYGIKLYVYITIVFTPIVPTILWLGFFVLMDLITGIWKAKHASTPISSKKLSHTVTKLVLYMAAMLCSHIMDTQFLNIDWLPAKVSQLIAGFIAVVEFKSVIENISAILGMPIWKYIQQKLYRNETNN